MGQLRELSTHAELRRTGRLYFKLYQLQYRKQEIGAGAAQRV